MKHSELVNYSFRVQFIYTAGIILDVIEDLYRSIDSNEERNQLRQLYRLVKMACIRCEHKVRMEFERCESDIDDDGCGCDSDDAGDEDEHDGVIDGEEEECDDGDAVVLLKKDKRLTKQADERHVSLKSVSTKQPHENPLSVSIKQANEPVEKEVLKKNNVSPRREKIRMKRRIRGAHR